MGALTARRQGRLARECAASATINLTSIMNVPSHGLKIVAIGPKSKETAAFSASDIRGWAAGWLKFSTRRMLRPRRRNGCYNRSGCTNSLARTTPAVGKTPVWRSIIRRTTGSLEPWCKALIRRPMSRSSHVKRRL